jgi:hypothetical protein
MELKVFGTQESRNVGVVEVVNRVSIFPLLSVSDSRNMRLTDLIPRGKRFLNLGRGSYVVNLLVC